MEEAIQKAKTVSASDDNHQLLSWTDTLAIAQQHHHTSKQIEITALKLGIIPIRYERNMGTVGIAGQLALLQARVAVVGLGGLGGWVVEALARMGVGNLVLIDADRVQESNLNRQMVALENTLGESKAVLAAEQVKNINRGIETTIYPHWATEENLPDLLQDVDIVVDALDSLSSRFALQRAAAALQIPLVHGAIAGLSGQVMTILPGDRGLAALYGEKPTIEHGLEATLGNPATTPMIVAAWQAQQVVNWITNVGELLRNRLLLLDGHSGTVDQIELG